MSLKLTLRQAQALEILGRIGPCDVESFSREMWPRGIATKYASFFFRKLERSQYATLDSAQYSITEVGRAVVQSPEWYCASCKIGFFTLKKSPLNRACRSCGGGHHLCRRCVKGELVTTGDFPNYAVVLRRCPVPKPQVAKRVKKDFPKVDDSGVLYL